MWQHVCNGKVCFKLMQSMNNCKYRLQKLANRQVAKSQTYRRAACVCCVQRRVRLSQGVWRGTHEVFASSQTHHVSLYIPPSTECFNI